MSLIASVLRLDRAAIKGLKITDPYSLHRVIYSLFPRQEDDKLTTGRILYADKGGDYRSRQILMLSPRPPLPQVDGRYGEVESRVLSEHFLEHKSYAFQVIVNPTTRNGASRKIMPVRGREAVAQWFTSRAPTWGFLNDPHRLQVDHIEVLQFKGNAQREITIGQAHLRGVLTVEDSTKFKESFANGVGRARAFGCGLLQIVPVVENPFFHDQELRHE